MPSPLIQIRQSPRISANKLGEFLAEHKAGRRRAILKDQKVTRRCRVIQYTAARYAIVSAVTAPGHELEILSHHLGRLKEWSPGADASSAAITENRICREAIEAFQEIVPTLDFGGLTPTRGDDRVPKLTKAGVDISVRPDILLHGSSRGQDVSGLIKLHFPKSNPLGPIAGGYVGAILHEFGETHHSSRGACLPKYCYVIDVFSKQLYIASSNYAKRREDIEAGCQEIATLWDSIPVG